MLILTMHTFMRLVHLAAPPHMTVVRYGDRHDGLKKLPAPALLRDGSRDGGRRGVFDGGGR